MTHQRMHEEIMEIADETCSEREIDFLENIESRLESLSEKQARWLKDIHDRACRSAY